MFIVFKEETFGNSEGDRVYVQHEENNEYYYYDSFGRWCYVRKDEKGEAYEIEGNRLGQKWRCRA